MNPEEVLVSIEREAPRRGLPIIGPERGGLLDEIVRKHKPRKILEIGTLVGYSAIRMARLLGEEGRVTCIEVNGEIARIARSNLEKAGLSGKVEIVVGDAKEAIPKLTGIYDMIFIDAEKEEYIAYLKRAERLMRPGTVVVADNVKVFADRMADYLDYVRNSGKYRSTYKEPRSGVDAIEVSVRT